MTTLVELLYYGDQSVEPLDSIEELVAESQNSALLTEFLCSAFKKLTLHISKFPHNERALFKETNFGTLAQSIRKNRTHHVATSTVLSCVAQLGWTIR